MLSGPAFSLFTAFVQKALDDCYTCGDWDLLP